MPLRNMVTALLFSCSAITMMKFIMQMLCFSISKLVYCISKLLDSYPSSAMKFRPVT